MNSVPVLVPDLGDLKHAEVIEILATLGGEVTRDAPLMQLESDKAVLEVSSPLSGVVSEMLVQVGDKVITGQRVAAITQSSLALTEVIDNSRGADAGQARNRPIPSEMQEQARPPRGAIESEASGDLPNEKILGAAPDARVYAGPAVRRLAREVGIQLQGLRGRGPRGRILRDDVLAAVRGMSERISSVSETSREESNEKIAALGPVDLLPLSRIQKVSARRLTEGWRNVPHVTQHNDADITEIEAERLSLGPALKARGLRLTILAFLLRAVALTLREMPRFNASLHPDGSQLAMRRDCHLGFAADTELGLVVPVVRDADRKDIFEIAVEIEALSANARSGKIMPSQLQGSTFTVSSLGGIGGTHFTPIVNPPEVAILGAGRARRIPRYVGSNVEPRLILPLSLSYDHRVIDGVAGVRFTERICDLLSEPARLLAAVP